MKKFDTNRFMTNAKKVLGAQSENIENSLAVKLKVGFQQLLNIRDFVEENADYKILKEGASSIDIYEVTLLCPTEEKANELRTISEGW